MNYIPCGKCDNGYLYSGDVVTKCSCLSTYQKDINLYSGMQKAGLSMLDSSITLKDYKGPDKLSNLPKLESYLRDYVEKYSFGASLYFWSTENGTQKTTLSKAILVSLVKKGYSTRFILMGDLLHLLMKADQNDSLQEKVQDYLNCDFLVIDDSFSKRKATLYSSGYQLAFLDKFLRYRIESLKKNVLFTANLPISDIAKEGFGSDIQDLLHRSIYVKGGQLQFLDKYVSVVSDFEIKGMWD